MRQMGEKSTLGPNRTSGINRFADTHVSRMRSPPERVQDEDFQIRQLDPFRLGHGLHIGDVGQRAKSVAEDSKMPVPERQRQNPDSGDRNFASGLERLQVELGFRSPFVGPDCIVENVGETGAHPLQRLGRAVTRDGTPLPHREDAEIVDAVDVIGVLMSVEDGVHPAQAGTEHLQPEFRRGIDQDDVATGLEQRTGAAAPIAGILRPADRAVAANLGDSEGGSGPEESQAHGGGPSAVSRQPSADELKPPALDLRVEHHKLNLTGFRLMADG